VRGDDCTEHARRSPGRERVRRGEEGGIGDVICEECGETNKSRTEFCMFCGAYMGWQDDENPSGAADVTQPMPTQPAARPAAQSSQSPRTTPAAAAPAQSTQSPTAPVATQASRPQSSQQHPAQQQPSRPQAGVSPHGPAGHSPTAQYAVTVAAGAPPADPRAPATPAAPAVALCPTCDRRVDDGRRFCGHCGTQFIGPGASGAPLTRPVAKRDTWWSRLWNRHDRGARRAFRRSLPPLYRWRRVIIAVLALVLIGAGLTLIGRSPKSFVLARYYDIKGPLVPVTPVTAAIIPAEVSVAGIKLEVLVDGMVEVW
jgi:hypothetical protein